MIFFTSNLSTTTSIIQSQCFIFSKSSVKLPVVIFFNFDFVKRGEGLDFTEFSNDKSTKLFLDFLFFSDSLSSGTISNKRTSISTLARWQAIPEPIIPEPNTATFFMFNSLQRFDLVDIYVVFFSAPLIVAILSAYFLKDVLSVKGFLLMLLSFGSIVYSLGPSMKVLSPELIFPLVPPLCWALYQFFTKLISGNNDPFAAVFYTAIIGTIVSSVYISFNWVPLEKNIYWIPLIIMGIAGFVSHFILILSLIHI